MEQLRQKLTLRPSVPGDEAALKALWQSVFGDTDAFIDSFFDTLYTPGTACLALSGEALASAGYCLPGVTALGKRCAYIYAVATDPEYRGLGAAAAVCRLLRDRAFAGGADLVACLPASASLTGWYERVLDMVPSFRKGLPGAEFPPAWHRFAARWAGGEEDAPPASPDRLWAVGVPGVDPADFRDVGWALTFE